MELFCKIFFLFKLLQLTNSLAIPGLWAQSLYNIPLHPITSVICSVRSLWKHKTIYNNILIEYWILHGLFWPPTSILAYTLASFQLIDPSRSCKKFYFHSSNLVSPLFKLKLLQSLNTAWPMVQLEQFVIVQHVVASTSRYSLPVSLHRLHHTKYPILKL